MFNLKIISVFVLFLFGNLIYAQNTNNKYLVIYLEKRITSEDGLNRINKFPKILKERMLKQINIGEEKLLFIDNNMSFFSLKKNIKKKETVIEEGIDKTSKLITTDYYKRGNDSSLILTKNIHDKVYVIKTKLHPFKWELIDETKYIKSMNCKKAKNIDDKGNEIEAWYTEDIPISNGPSIYGGLPGLIIELKTKSKAYSVKNIEKTNTEEKINFPSTENSITMESFKKEFNSNNNKPKKSIRYN